MSKVEVASVVRSYWGMDVHRRGMHDFREGGGIWVWIFKGVTVLVSTDHFHYMVRWRDAF